MIAIPGGAVGSARVNQTSDTVRNCLSVPSYTAIGDTFTVSGWFNAYAKIGWHRLLSRKTAYGTDGWEVEMYSGSDKIDVYGSGEAKVCTEVSDLEGSWNHLAFVYRGDKVEVYQNGQKIASGGITPVEDLVDRPFSIGNNSVCGERSFIGSYDEVRLQRGALSAERIAADYATATKRDFFAYGSVGIPAANAPVMTVPVLAKNEQGELMVSLSMTSGTGRPHVRFVSADEKIDIALTASIPPEVKSWSLARVHSLSDRLRWRRLPMPRRTVLQPAHSQFPAPIPTAILRSIIRWAVRLRQVSIMSVRLSVR